MKGYAGNNLRIDLTNETIKTFPTDEKTMRRFLGGRGFGAKVLWDEVAGVDPFSPENKIIVTAGPLSGLFLPAAGKTHFTSKSPLTGGFGDSNMGGFFCAEMKYAGYDSIIIEGKSDKPVYIVIKNNDVQIRDASHLWGKGALTGEEIIRKELGEEYHVSIIGQGGENLVRFACINSDYGREAGRAGIGAVFGSKKLKAIAVTGTKDIEVADYEKFMKVTKEIFEACFKHPDLKPWQRYGTSQVVTWASEIGALPTRNFSTGTFEHAEAIGGETMRQKVVKLDKACNACPMACGKWSYSGKYGHYAEGGEYETLALMGSNCSIDDIETVIEGNYLCDEYGIDTISTGNVIGFVMEATEKGLMNEARFGDKEKYLELIRKIAFREGTGDLLAEGVKRVSEKVGGKEYAIQIKGMEQSGYESRGAPAMQLAYMTCDVGAHHNRAWAITQDIKVGRDVLDGKAEWVIRLQHIRPMFDQLGVCRLQWVELAVDLNYYARLFEAVTGWPTTLDELLTSSERTWNLTRAYWFREVPGFGRTWDMPPARVYKEDVPDGATKGMKLTEDKLNYLLDDYYKLRGWDSNGKPTSEKLKTLGLEEVIGKI